MDLSEYSKPMSFTADSDIGILTLHGFTGTTSSVKYLGEKFHEAGFDVEVPSLTGHGTHWRDLNNVSYHQWIEDVRRSLEKLKERCRHIFICGFSMGGSLALEAAQKDPSLAGIILINHALIFSWDIRITLLPVLKYILPSVPGVGSDLKDPEAIEAVYERVPLKGSHQLIRLLENVKGNLKKVRQPTLILKSVSDHIIPTKSATYTYDNIASEQKELIWLDNSYHVAPLDFDKDRICELSIRFVRRTLSDQPAA